MATFLPTNRAEMTARGWSTLDILLVTGDAYIDHPTFGVPLLGRWLENHGYKVGIVAAPRTNELTDFQKMGRPRLFVGVSSGTVDSMLNNYTANKKTRSDDQYAPGGKGGLRPDYASIVYAQLMHKAYPSLPIIGGGVEVSLRRLAHYDYWQNRVRPSILLDAPFSAAVFGMAEQTILDLASLFTNAIAADQAFDLQAPYAEQVLNEVALLRGVCALRSKEFARNLNNRLLLPSFEEVRQEKKKFARAALLIEKEANPHNGKKLVQYHGSQAVIINEPPIPLETAQMDAIYGLPFTREQHPSYQEKIPAFEMIRFSVTACRGCFGGCSFCAITLHHGRIVQSRSEQSVVAEVQGLVKQPGFTGHVSDVGGATANAWNIHCVSLQVQQKCRKFSCLYPKPCIHLQKNHGPQIAMLRKCRAVPGIKSIRVASGIRYDLCFADSENGEKYLREVIAHHVGGQLKVAPEHLEPAVLHLMRKPGAELFHRFLTLFEQESARVGKQQYVIPYFISGFPGCTNDKMRTVHDYLQRKNWNLQQVQGFIPTPMTMATAMFWTGLDPETKEPIFVAKSSGERFVQRKLLQPARQNRHHR